MMLSYARAAGAWRPRRRGRRGRGSRAEERRGGGEQGQELVERNRDHGSPPGWGARGGVRRDRRGSRVGGPHPLQTPGRTQNATSRSRRGHCRRFTVAGLADNASSPKNRPILVGQSMGIDPICRIVHSAPAPR